MVGGGGKTPGRMSVGDRSVIRCCKNVASPMRWVLNDVLWLVGQTSGHNIAVEILIPNRKLAVLPFHTYEGCMNCLILVGALFSMNINVCQKCVIIIHLLWVKMSSSNPIYEIMNAKSLTKPNFTDWLRNLNLYQSYWVCLFLKKRTFRRKNPKSS